VPEFRRDVFRGFWWKGSLMLSGWLSVEKDTAYNSQPQTRHLETLETRTATWRARGTKNDANDTTLKGNTCCVKVWYCYYWCWIRKESFEYVPTNAMIEILRRSNRARPRENIERWH
jgi:hypothetical protein